MSGSLITLDGQGQIRDLLFGRGTPFPLVEDGPAWWDRPPARASDIARARRHGSDAPPDLLDSLTLVLEVLVAGDSPEEFQARRDELMMAWGVSAENVALAFRWGGSTRLRFGRTRNASVPSSLVGVGHTAVASLQFVALDPLMYSATEHSGSTGVGEVTGGLGFPHGFPHGFGFASPGTIEVHNGGSVAAPWTATLVGPLVSPRITTINGEGGDLDFAGFTLDAGQTLEIDSAARTVLLGGTASRYGALTSRRWFNLAPGTTTVHLGASAGEGTLTMRWRDAWL